MAATEAEKAGQDTDSPGFNDAGSKTSETAKKTAPGVVLGKDGKPCRSCTSGAAFSAWTAQTKAVMKAPATASALHVAAPMPASDCPADVEVLGRSSWTLLHSIAANYPVSPSAAEQDDVRRFLGLFSRLYPCWVCAEDFQTYMQAQPVRAETRSALGAWLCAAHNDVNKKLGKPVFDCARWEERWRTGWKDGRCG